MALRATTKDENATPWEEKNENWLGRLPHKSPAESCSRTSLSYGTRSRQFDGAVSLWVGLWVEVFGATAGNLLKEMVGLGGLEPPTSPLSGAFMVLYA